MSNFKTVILATAVSVANASVDGGEANKVYFGGDDGNDTIFVKGNENYISGGNGDDTIFSSGYYNLVAGDAGNDEISVEGDYNGVYGDAGNDIMDVIGNGNLIADDGGCNSIFSYGDCNEYRLSNGVQDIVAFGSENTLNVGDGAHQILTVGSDNEVVLGRENKNVEIYFIASGNMDIYAKDECGNLVKSHGDDKTVKSYLELEERVSKAICEGGTYNEKEFAVREKYRGYHSLILDYLNSQFMDDEECQSLELDA